MESTVKLSSLPLGDWGVVTRIEAQPDMARRLKDMGLVTGTRVMCRLVSPAGDPRAYVIRGALIALRQKDADGIRVEPWQGC